MEAEAAALAPALAQLTRASNATISVVCSDALQRMDHDQDRAVEARAAGSQEEAQVECERLLGEGVWIKRLLVQQAERHLNGQLGAGRRQALRLASVLTGAQRTWRRATWT